MESDEKTLLKHWVKIYPTYLDKTLKVSEGRKVANTLAVETPTLQEIAEICVNLLKLPIKPQAVYIFNIRITIQKIG